MNSRERLLTAMSRGIPDRVPRDLSWGFSPLFYEKFREKTGRTDYLSYFEVDSRFLNFRQTEKKIDFSGYFYERAEVVDFYTDEWGVGHTKSKNTELHFEHMIAPLKYAKSVKDIMDFPLPDFIEDYRHAHFEEEVRKLHAQGLAVAGPLAQTLFEQAWLIRGFEDFMTDMLENEDMAECLLDRLLDLRIKMAERYAVVGIDVLMLGDDIAMQSGMLISPVQWRKWLKPRLAAIISRAKAINPDLHIFYHSDGNPQMIIDDLIEIGVNVLNPIQPECFEPAEVKKKYGDRLAFWGAIGVQTNLPFGTSEDVRSEVKLRMETIGRNGGFIIGPTHFIEPEVPWENLVTMFDAIEEFGYYR
jgi:uroporphyrinogen decarboxylase